MIQKSWTLEDIEDQSGKIIIVTGANSGIGFEATKVFAKNNAHVVMACRNIEKAKEASRQIKLKNKNAKLTIIELNLSDLSSIQSFVSSFKKSFDRLDTLLNNAGIMNVPYKETKDGFELQNGVNHIGHFALTAQLFDVIRNTPNARIVNVSSLAHRFGKMDFENYLYENGKYSKVGAYGRSKLSNLLFTYELHRRVQEKELDIKVLAAHPGVASTNLGRYSKTNLLMTWITNAGLWFAQSQLKGSLPLLRASLDKDAESGQYYGPSGLGEMKGNPEVVKSKPHSHNIEDAKKLWVLSEKLANITFQV